MELDYIIQIDEEQRLLEGKGTVINVLNKLKNMKWGGAKKFLRDNFAKFVDYTEEYDIDDDVTNIINKHLKTNFRSVNDALMLKVLENKEINEGIKDWWSEASGNLYSSMAFYPILMVFLELDKLIKSLEGANIQTVVIYAIIWLAVITGKVVSGQLINKNVPSQEKEAKKIAASLHPTQVR